MASFAANITKFVQKTQLRADQVLRKVALDAYRGLVDRSPVGNPDLWQNPHHAKGYTGGKFKGNWRVGIDHPDLTVNEEKLPAGQGNYDSRVIETLGSVKFGSTILITNNDDKAEVIEHGMPGVIYPDGRKAHSSQAPTGVLQNTFDDLKNKLESAIQRLDQE